MGKGKAMELFGFGEPDTASAGERMKSACCGVCIGIVLFLGALGVLGWNEKRAVYTAQTIDFARTEFVQVDGCEPADDSTGKLIAFQGCEPAPDANYAPDNYDLLEGVVRPNEASGAVFAPADAVFSWARHTQQYASHEIVTSSKSKKSKSKSKSKSKTTPTYRYENEWVNTAQVYKQKGVISPPGWPKNWGDTSGVAPLVCIGGNAHSNASCSAANGDSWLLHSSVSWDKSKIRNMGNSDDVAILPYASVTTTLYTTYPSGSRARRAEARSCGNGHELQTQLDTHYNLKCTPQAATAHRQGDFRFTFTRKTGGKNYVVSGLAKQTKNEKQYGLEEWQNPDHSGCSYCTIGTITEGSKSGDEILNDLASANKALTWVLRFVGWLVCWFGLQLVAGPVAIAPDFVPVVGDMLGGILGPILCCLTCTLATSFALLAIAIAWLAYRPLIAIPLLAVFFLGCAGAVVLVLKFKKKRKNVTDYNEAGPINSGSPYQPADLYPLTQQTSPNDNPYPSHPAGSAYPPQPTGNPYPPQPASNPYPTAC